MSIDRRRRRTKGTVGSRFLEEWARADKREGRTKPLADQARSSAPAPSTTIAPAEPRGVPMPPEVRAAWEALQAKNAAEIARARPGLRELEQRRDASPRGGRDSSSSSSVDALTSSLLERLPITREEREEIATALRSKDEHGSAAARVEALVERERREFARVGPVSIGEVSSSADPEVSPRASTSTGDASPAARALIAAAIAGAPTEKRRERRGGRARARQTTKAITRARARFEAQCEKDAPGCKPRPLEAWCFAVLSLIMRDDTGKEAERLLEERRSWGWPGVDRCLLAATGFAEDRRRPLSAFRARAIVALWIVIMGSSRETRRRGYWRKTEGFTCRALRVHFTMPGSGDVPSRSAFDATCWGADRKEPDDCGYLVALERAGCWKLKQPIVLEEGDEASEEEREAAPRGYYADRRYVGRTRYVDRKTGRPVRCAFGVFWIYGAAGPPE